MNFSNVVNAVNAITGKVSFTAKKYSPEILLGLGIVSSATAVVTAIKSTTKASEVINEHKDEMDKIHTVLEDPKYADADYSEEMAKKDTVIVYTKTAVKLAKLYAPTISSMIVGIACCVGSYNILKNRNAAISAAYFALDQGFRAYRKRVVDKFGEDVDRQMRYGAKVEEVVEVVKNEDGTESVVTHEEVTYPDGPGIYAKLFDELNPMYKKNASMNLLFIKQSQNLANQMLQEKGYLFLSDVYDILCIPQTKASRKIGWLYDKNNPNLHNFIDFGVFAEDNVQAKNFREGYERAVLLDFNPDGDIYNLMQEEF